MASGSAGAASRLTPAATVIAVAGAMLAAHLAIGALTPITEDEAYYRLWSLRPAWGYYDHPPMVAWMTWLGRQIAGDDLFAIRLFPSLAGALTTWLTYDLARAAGLADRIAGRAGVWLAATALMALGVEMAVPDAPGTLFWTAALCCAFRAANGRHGAWWLAAGAAAGLACLSKYSALFLAPGLLLWLALTEDGRRQLKTPWPWLAGLIAAAIFAPNIAWNAGHGWLTFAKQFGRIEAKAGFGVGYLVKFLTDQFVLLNPAIAIFLGIAVWRRTCWPVLIIAAPFAAYLLVHSLHDEVQGQWPAPLYPLAAIAAAAAAENARGWLAGLRAATAPVAFAIYAAIAVFIVWPSNGDLPFRDPLHALRAWPAFETAVEEARVKAGAAWVGANTYGIAATLADAPQIHAPAVEIFERERFTFEIPAEQADFSKPGLVLVPTRGSGGRVLPMCFADVQPLPEIDRGAGSGTTYYSVFRVSRPKRDIERDGCYRPPDPKR